LSELMHEIFHGYTSLDEADASHQEGSSLLVT